MRSKGDQFLVLAQLVVAAALTGMIWLVQVVSYPQFLDLGAADFEAFHARYTAGVAPVVGPLMIFELGFAAVSVWRFRRTSLRWLFVIGAGLVAGLWFSTLLIQVPLHEVLSTGWDEPVARQLIASNWIRTILWSIRTALIFYTVIRIRGTSANRTTASVK